ncbi:MAG: type II toxin-antitoxin system HicB family antitoxin [Leptospirales bacterium]|nr:type II toxin-antitoxin system HicB family antitoxin [Leptospirales bacterium]
MKDYIALFEENGKGGYGVVFPDLPGCISAGSTYEEAYRMAHEALALYCDGEDNVPKPRSLEKIKKEWVYWKEWIDNYNFLIGYITLYPLKTKVKKFNIAIDERLVKRIDRITKNRSAFIVEAIESFLKTGTDR